MLYERQFHSMHQFVVNYQVCNPIDCFGLHSSLFFWSSLTILFERFQSHFHFFFVLFASLRLPFSSLSSHFMVWCQMGILSVINPRSFREKWSSNRTKMVFNVLLSAWHLALDLTMCAHTRFESHYQHWFEMMVG